MSDSPAPSTSSKANMGDLRKGISGDAGTHHDITVPDHPDDPDAFPSWPKRTGETLPSSFIDRIVNGRAAMPAYPFVVVSRKPKNSPKDAPKVNTGYSYGGEQNGLKPTVILTPEEEKDPKRKAVVLAVFQDMFKEGGVSAVMTGDDALFTWGRGISFLSPALPQSFRDFLQKAPGAKDALLECGITIVGSSNADWRIVDVKSGKVLSGKEAIQHLNGFEPAEEKKGMLSCIAKVTGDFLQQATDSQWYAFKLNFMYYGAHKVPEDVIQTWPPKTVAYVVHAGAYGNFVDAWPEYGATHGDPAKILRIAAKRYQHTDVGNHILVPQQAGSAAPSTTLLFGMGQEMMVNDGIVTRLDGYPGSAQAGDVVFEITPKRQTAKTGTHMVLREQHAAAKASADSEPFDMEKWVDAHQGLEMGVLLTACEDLGYDRLRHTREWYSRLVGPADKPVPAEKDGPRIRLAMDAVLHKGEGEGGRWILDAAERAKLVPPQYEDQYNLLKAKIGIA